MFICYYIVSTNVTNTIAKSAAIAVSTIAVSINHNGSFFPCTFVNNPSTIHNQFYLLLLPY